MATNKSVLDLDYKTTLTDSDSFVASVSGIVSRVKLSTLKTILKQWNDILNKPFSDIDINDFTVSGNTLSLASSIKNGLHSHLNKTYLDKIGQSNQGKLMYDGVLVSSDWSDITNKPFSTLSEQFIVSNGELSIDSTIFSYDWNDIGDKPFETLSNQFTVSDGELGIDSSLLSFDWDDINDKPFSTLSNDFVVSNDALSISTDIKHTHLNKTVLDKFSEVSGQLLYNGSEIGGGLDFTELSRAMTTGTLTGLTITADTTDNNFDITVTGMPTIAIDNDGYWTIDGVSTGQQSKGDNGITPSIDSTSKHWMIGSTDTGVIAEGQNGSNGNDGITPTIDSSSKHWMIGSTDTGVVAEGQNGVSPTVSFSSITGGNRMTVVDGSGTSTVDIMDGVTTISTTKTDLTCTALATDWVGVSAPYTQTITVNGLTSSLNPVIDVVISNTVQTGLEEQKQWGYITKATTGTNSLTLSCYKNKPTIDLNIMIEVV